MSWFTAKRQDNGIDRNLKVLDNGRWIPSYDVLAVGTFTSATSGVPSMLLNHSYRVFTRPRPFPWYVFGFSANWETDQLQDTLIDVADMSKRENMCGGFFAASALLGTEAQLNPGWLPLQYAAYEIEGLHKFWAEATLENPAFKTGLKFWIDRDKQARFIAPYVMHPGKIMRFIVANRCEGDFEGSLLTVVGMRWLNWDAERVDNVIR